MLGSICTRIFTVKSSLLVEASKERAQASRWAVWGLHGVMECRKLAVMIRFLKRYVGDPRIAVA